MSRTPDEGEDVKNRLNEMIGRVATVFRQEAEGDGHLLELFIQQRDEAAFEALVRHHGPMVFGVCRRVLGNTHDAEDAFQATFLVLARRAASVRPRNRVGNWLYGVAYRTAQEARRGMARRQAREAKAMPRVEASEAIHDDLRAILDQELASLPDKYREVIVLCDLEGEGRKEVARKLGCPEGTLASRLARARDMLAKRLTRHGLPLVAGSLVAALAQEAASASVPAALMPATVKAAIQFAAGSTVPSGVISATVVALTEGVGRNRSSATLRD